VSQQTRRVWQWALPIAALALLWPTLALGQSRDFLDAREHYGALYAEGRYQEAERFADAALRLIPVPIDRHSYAHCRVPMEMIFQGWSMRLFQA
jgi:tetratricopeptide (TPR) repeat protein